MISLSLELSLILSLGPPRACVTPGFAEPDCAPGRHRTVPAGGTVQSPWAAQSPSTALCRLGGLSASVGAASPHSSATRRIAVGLIRDRSRTLGNHSRKSLTSRYELFWRAAPGSWTRLRIPVTTRAVTCSPTLRRGMPVAASRSE